MPIPFPSILLNKQCSRYRVSEAGSTFDAIGQKIPSFTEIPVQILECHVIEGDSKTETADSTDAPGMVYRRQFHVFTPFDQIVDSPYNRSVGILGLDGNLQPVLTDVKAGDRIVFEDGSYPEMRVQFARNDGGSDTYWNIHAYSLSPTGD